MNKATAFFQRLKMIHDEKVVVQILLPITITVLILLGIAGKIAADLLEENLLSSAESVIKTQSGNILQELDVINTLMTEQVRTGNNILRDEAKRFGEPGLQGTSDVSGKMVPSLYFGKTMVNLNYSIVDKVKNLAGGTATFFVKSGSDFVRVSTNVLKPDQTRAVGSVLDPKGKAMQAIRSGNGFTGVVEILNKMYFTCYEPITANNETIGIYYTGYPINSLAQLGKLIKESKIMQHGFFAVLDNKDRIIFHSDVIDTTNLVQLIKDVHPNQAHWNIRRFSYGNWNFSIVAGIYLEEVHEQIFAAQLLVLGFAVVFFIGVGSSVYFIFTKRVGSRLKKLTEISNSLAAGDVAVKVEVRSADEIGQLEKTFAKMIDGIKEQTQTSVQIAAGDFGSVVVERSEKDVLAKSLNSIVVTLRELTGEIAVLIQAGINGKLQTRADASKHKGEYRGIVDGINKILDAVIDPTRKSALVLEKLAKGDLTARVNEQFSGEHQHIVDSINTVGESLHEAIVEVVNSVHAVASASTQISSSTEELAAGSQEQSSQTADVAASIEEMSRTILENTKNATTSSDLAREAGMRAKDGGKVVDETITGMNQIAEVVNRSANTVFKLGASSDKIGEIVQVIDDIADQTNLLALNAAIEAARAGEQGRGFAVVADEVRKLAERTTKATKEIASMIKEIQTETHNAVSSMQEGTKEVEQGKVRANRAGEMLGVIVQSTEGLKDIITQVAAASEEQSAAVDEISKNIEAINSVTQESSNGLHQIAATADDLNKLTENLQNLVSRFVVSHDDKSPMRRLN